MSWPIKPLDWAEPLTPYRWVGVAAVAILFFLALYSLLKPKVHV